MNCSKCQQPIEEERLSVLPETKVCASCARNAPVSRVRGVMLFDHKTAPYVHICSEKQQQEIKKATARKGQHSILFRNSQQYDGGTL